jgi:hypothetical protein
MSTTSFRRTLRIQGDADRADFRATLLTIGSAARCTPFFKEKMQWEGSSLYRSLALHCWQLS